MTEIYYKVYINNFKKIEMNDILIKIFKINIMIFINTKTARHRLWTRI